MDLTIREARPDDAEGVVQVLNPIIETGKYTVLDTPVTADFEREFIENFPQSGVFHLAESNQDRKIAGFQTVERFAAYTRAFDHVGIIATYIYSRA